LRNNFGRIYNDSAMNDRLTKDTWIRSEPKHRIQKPSINRNKDQLRSHLYMPEDNLKTRVISSLFWKFLERGGVAGVQLIVQIILARLSSCNYGVIALIVVFISISQVFVQSGLGIALIQKKNVTDVDYSSVFLPLPGDCTRLLLHPLPGAPL